MSPHSFERPATIALPGVAGEISGDPAVAGQDYAASPDFMEETLEGSLVACGYSFGAATAVRASRGRARLRRLLLVSPPPQLLDAEALAEFEGDLLVATGEQDPIAPPGELAALAQRLPRARFVPISDADHFFMQGLGELGRLAADWLGTR